MGEPEVGLMVTPGVRLVRPLSEGGMGSVWIADHLSLHTEVVVKFMSTDLLKSPEAVQRFAREAAAASQVKSPHVVQMFDHGVMDTGVPYIVMELLEGHDLGHYIDVHGKIPPVEIVGIVAQLSRALGKAHGAGIVHRDIKPNNIFLCDAGGGELFVKLLDFGIAKSSELSKNAALVGSTTRTGSFVGSPFYMSPEQVIGAKTIDYRTDLWSLGVVAYEALTGEKPFFAETVGGLALKIHRDPLPVPTRVNRDLPIGVDAWFARACAREPTERFASAKEMADALSVAITGERAVSGVGADSGPRGGSVVSALASTAPALAMLRSVSPSGSVDVKSQTDAGVDLATARTPAPRGKMIAAFAIGVVAVGLGFLVPRLIRGSNSTTTTTASTTASATTPTPTLTLSLTPALTPTSPTPASATASASAAPTQLPKSGAPTPPRASITPPAASSFAAPQPPPPVSATGPAKPPPPKPTAGSDDDIK